MENFYKVILQSLKLAWLSELYKLGLLASIMVLELGIYGSTKTHLNVKFDEY